jgi:GR25 family glycosyltransferase involved in LPS biosynthesis
MVEVSRFDMRYTIISINDDRIEKRRAIEETVDLPKVHIPSVNGMNGDLNRYFQLYQTFKTPEFKALRGELGIWFSQMNCWQYTVTSGEPLIVFEDDAMVDPSFNDTVGLVMNEIPDDWDFFSFFVPDNQRQDYFYNVKYNNQGIPGALNGFRPPTQSLFYIGSEVIAKAYQGYSVVCTMYSPKGARRLLELTSKHGIHTPVDNFIFRHAHGSSQVKGYAMHPRFKPMPVWYDWENSPTCVHNTEVYDASQ